VISIGSTVHHLIIWDNFTEGVRVAVEASDGEHGFHQGR